MDVGVTSVAVIAPASLSVFIIAMVEFPMTVAGPLDWRDGQINER
jgi:hypothetical protein